jgi:AcrR family transcriptional regulator
MARMLPGPNRRERRKQALQRRILAVSEELFEKQGYDETPVSQICEQVDIAYGTFFNHFVNKQDLLKAYAARSVRQMAETLENLSKRNGTIEDLLIELFEGGARGFEELTPHRRELPGRIQALAFSDSAADHDRHSHAAFEAFLRSGVEDGRVRTDVPVDTLADVVSNTDGMMSLGWVHFEDYPVHRRAAAAARFLASSLEPRANHGANLNPIDRSRDTL